MAAAIDSPAQLSDNQLLAAVKQQAAVERQATAALIRLLMELDTRRIYLGEGYASLFTYCTQALHLAEGSAYNRIEAARAGRRFPVILDALEDGSLTLTAVRLLAPHLTDDNHRDVLAAARHQRKREIEVLVASLQPKPDAPAVVRRLPVKAPRRVAVPSRDAGPQSVVPPQTTVALASPAPVSPTAAQPRQSVTPLAPARYKRQLTISEDTHGKLRRAQALLRHAVPDGDPAEVLDRALTLLLADLERRRCAATPCPRSTAPLTHESRYIPAAVRREVWARDQGRCAFVGAAGRCAETGFLEFHHVEPYAAGASKGRCEDRTCRQRPYPNC